MKKKLILIAGPTASGKTQSSVLLAKKINGEIISADSMQVYRGMDIGTAKVKPEEMQGIPHYMIDELDPETGCDVAFFKEKVKSYIASIHEKNKIPILVGGTGFYINAILYDVEFGDEKKEEAYRKELEIKAKVEGVQALHDLLRTVDEVSANAIHPNNVKRVIRALEYFHQTGKPISQHNALEKQKQQLQESPYDATFFVLSMARDCLYERINRRVDQMLEEGLLKEVEHFFRANFTEDMTSMRAIGYKEFFPYFRGEASLQDCIEQLKQNTRHYAKRQMTWFRNQTLPHFIQVDQLGFDAERITNEMLEKIR